MRFIGLAAVSAVLLGLTAPARGDDKPKDKEEKVVTTKSGLKYIDQKEGTGKEAKSGDKVVVHYSGWLKDGTPFDSSRKPDREPLEFTIGVSRIIQGWHEGIAGMKEGGKRKLIIPPK